MRKLRRKAIIREAIESKLAKISVRMQHLSEDAYKLRQMLEQIDALAPQVPYVKPKEGDVTPVVEAPVQEKLVEVSPTEVTGA